MSSDANKIAKYVSGLEAIVPTRAWKSTVVIVRAQKPDVIQLGTGTLFKIADRSFVITAAHVIRSASDGNQTLGIGGEGGNFIALSESAICSNDTRNDFGQDLFDVAVVPLTDRQMSRLEGNTFLRVDDVSFSPVSENSFVSLFGFPHCWSTRSTETKPVMTLRPFQFTTSLYLGSTSNLENYSERLHLLLSANNENLYDGKGSSVRFQALGDQPPTFPSDLRGISGCSVWRIGDSEKSPAGWDVNRARLIAVQTGVYSRRQIIMSTRWVAVSTLLYQVFPELRSAIALFRSE